MGPSEEFIEALARDIPGFTGIYEAHLENEGEILDHVFFIDVVEATIDSYLGRCSDGPDWRVILSYLEEKFKLHIPEVDRVIVTSFLDALPYEGKPGADIARSLGPEMKAKLIELRPFSRQYIEDA